jgi:hypothetical protein
MACLRNRLAAHLFSTGLSCIRQEDDMFTPAKTLVSPLFGVFVLAASAMAQSADPQAAEQSDATAAPTPLTASAPPAIDDTTRPLEQAAAPNLGQGTKAQAEHSAEATAHKSLNDPNNQMGTSASGRTRPIVQADGTPQPLPSAAPQADAQQQQ